MTIPELISRAFVTLVFPLGVGVALGAIYYGGLWWTVQRAVSFAWVSLWFFTSLLLRTLIVMLGLYWACGPDWHRWVASLLGFVLARVVFWRLAHASVSVVSVEVRHTPLGHFHRTTQEPVFDAEKYLGSPNSKIVKTLALVSRLGGSQRP